MIKYYYKPSTKQTFAVLNGCKFDSINKISKFMSGFNWCMCTDKYMMNDTYRVSVRLAKGDEHNEEVARKYAKEKLMKKYYKDFDRKIDMFRSDLIEINSRVFETPEVLENTP